MKEPGPTAGPAKTIFGKDRSKGRPLLLFWGKNQAKRPLYLCREGVGPRAGPIACPGPWFFSQVSLRCFDYVILRPKQVPVSGLSFVDQTSGEDRTAAAREIMLQKAPELLELLAQVSRFFMFLYFPACFFLVCAPASSRPVDLAFGP